MERAAHAVVHDRRVWLVDPVDFAGLDDAVRDLGHPVAVLQLLDRHPRDCALVARRLGVPHLRLPNEVPDSPFEVITVKSLPKWREKALWWPERRVLVVAEAVGTVSYYLAPRETLAVHPMLRLLPPRSLRGLRPEHLLVGHGEPLHGPDVGAALEEALRTARRRAPSHIVRLVTTRFTSSR
jgi:hypothetical protein